MGNFIFQKFSHDKDEKKSKGRKFYVELVSDKPLPAAIPPFRVLINDQLTSSAVDSIKDSQLLANRISKSLISNLLSDHTTPEQFGTLLREIFIYEYIRAPTRDLAYWSLHLSDTKRNTFFLAKDNLSYWIKDSGYILIKDILCYQITHPDLRIYSISPLLKWTFSKSSSIIKPLTEVSATAIKDQEPLTTDTFKYFVSEFLKSEDSK